MGGEGSKAKMLNIYVLLIKCVFHREISHILRFQRVPHAKNLLHHPSPLVIRLVSMETGSQLEMGESGRDALLGGPSNPTGTFVSHMTESTHTHTNCTNRKNSY